MDACSGSNEMAGNVNKALLIAAANGSLAEVKAALKAGADVNIASEHTMSTLFIAALQGHADVVKLLLRKGASMVKRATEHGYSPLHAAAINGRTEVVEVLVRHGATVDIRDNDCVTPITYACWRGHADTVRRLIEFGARVDLMFDQHTFSAQQQYFKTISNDEKAEECLMMAHDALKKKQLRCCNPKCNNPGYRSDLKLCAGCKLTRYCNRECQKQHWSGGHKICCGQDEVL